MIDRLLKWKRRPDAIRPDIKFGRYSDNNKSVAKAGLWTESENLFKEKEFRNSIKTFFEYLRDDEAGNVEFREVGDEFAFEIYQGSKILRGESKKECIHTWVELARMSQHSVPVMRRLLEQNFNLFYSRYSLNGEKLMMQFDTEIDAANPNKLYYALKELAIMADKQDDLLVQDFQSLEKLDMEHVHELPEAEKEVKYEFFRKNIRESLDQVNTLDAEKYTGGVAYLLLALLYRIDFLIVPEGWLMHELERIQSIYFKKDNLSNIEKNRQMQQAIEKLEEISKEDFYRYLFRSKSTFAIRLPKNYSNVSEAITNANKSMIWYRDNKYPEIARQICEYGISFCQYTYSLPKVVTEYFQLLMEINYSEYFNKLGFSLTFYNHNKGKFDPFSIETEIERITRKWKEKFSGLNFRTSRLKYDNLVNFNHSFTTELSELNLETD